jgi:hypothetical protein
MVDMTAFKVGFYGNIIQRKLEKKALKGQKTETGPQAATAQQTAEGPQTVTGQKTAGNTATARAVNLMESPGGAQKIGECIDIVASQLGLSTVMRILGIVARILTTILSLGLVPLLLGQKKVKDIGEELIGFFKDARAQACYKPNGEQGNPSAQPDIVEDVGSDPKSLRLQAKRELYKKLTEIENEFSNGAQDKWAIIHAIRQVWHPANENNVKEFPNEGLSSLDDLNAFLELQIKSVDGDDVNTEAIKEVSGFINKYLQNLKNG